MLLQSVSSLIVTLMLFFFFFLCRWSIFRHLPGGFHFSLLPVGFLSVMKRSYKIITKLMVGLGAEFSV